MSLRRACGPWTPDTDATGELQIREDDDAMGMRLRRSVELFPGIRLNIGLQGVSLSLGGPGNTVNWGPRGLYVGGSLPGSGLSWRNKVAFHSRRLANTPRSGPRRSLPQAVDAATYRSSTMSLDDGLADLVAGLDQVRTQRSRIHLEALPLRRQRDALVARVHATRRSWWRRLFFGHQVPEWRRTAQVLTTDLGAVESTKDGISLDLQFEMSGMAAHGWGLIQRGFAGLERAAIADDVLSHASTTTKGDKLLRLKPVTVGPTMVPVVSTTSQALRLGNRNGDDYLFYPGFLMLQGSDGEPTCFIDYAELDVNMTVSEFKVPAGSAGAARILRQGYEHENRDGTPDRRMKRNRPMDVIEIGMLTINSDLGLNDRWMFSEPEAVRKMVKGIKVLATNGRHT